ncbi:alpha/beta hydrolase [Parapedobacter koreensis]|uniref:Acetyl esterase/lipase n=1 Tax=Parapedobacter koreensis TaxID=332977 RepID=A0A1H7GQM3_9SPHI|nr:alpha/beta hydrolase [Parapedobacter koreensis]SEK38880.1 Acetyl esterase/lipase [Parapedobacter koreensis]
MRRSIWTRLGILLIMAPLWHACKEDSPRPDDNNEVRGEMIDDLPYGEERLQQMDVYLPEGRSTANTGVIILIHGGSFVEGDKGQLDGMATKLLANGFAVVNINYRLVNSDGLYNTPPLHRASDIIIDDQLEDVSAAIEFAWDERNGWGVGSDKWYIAGHSAGATLAMLYAYGDRNGDARIKAVANWAGLTTIAFSEESEVQELDPEAKELFYRVVGVEATNQNRQAYRAASPYWVASNSGGVPTISVRPENNSLDFLPDYSEAQYESLTDLLNSRGSVSTHVMIQGADHAFNPPSKQDEVVEKTVAFFRAQ